MVVRKNSLKKVLEMSKIAMNVTLRGRIWFSKKKSTISYPEEGNNIYAKIEENSFWFKHRNDCILETVKNFPPNGWMFDIGGGNGFVALHLQKAGFNIVLMEANQSGVINAQKRGVYNLICSTLRNAGFKKNCLDAICLFDVLEHVKNDFFFLQQLKIYMRKESRIYITVPAYQFLWSFEDVIAGHYRRYSLKQIVELLKKTGYQMEYATYLFSLIPFPIFLCRTLPSKLFNFKKTLSLEKYQQKHQHPIANNLLNLVWNKEKEIIKNRRKLMFGSSCLVVAKKVNG